MELVLDQPALTGFEAAEIRLRSKRAEAREQPLVLCELGVKGSYLGQARVVGLAQRRCVHDRIQMHDLTPRPVEAILGGGKRQHETLPSGRGGSRRDTLDRGSRIGKQRVDGGRHMLWRDFRESGES